MYVESHKKEDDNYDMYGWSAAVTPDGDFAGCVSDSRTVNRERSQGGLLGREASHRGPSGKDRDKDKILLVLSSKLT